MLDMDKLLRTEIGSYERLSWTGEIGGQSITLHAKPITTADATRISKGGESNAVEGMVAAIILKAEDEHGEKVFKPAHKALLRRMATTKITEIFGALFGAQLDEETDESFEERVGN